MQMYICVFKLNVSLFSKLRWRRRRRAAATADEDIKVSDYVFLRMRMFQSLQAASRAVDRYFWAEALDRELGVGLFQSGAGDAASSQGGRGWDIGGSGVGLGMGLLGAGDARSPWGEGGGI